MGTETRPDVDLEELLEHEVPCGGVAIPAARRTCSSAAVLRLHPHCDMAIQPYHFKCIDCWQAWYVAISQVLDRQGWLRCHDTCGGKFYDVRSFADYRPF